MGFWTLLAQLLPTTSTAPMLPLVRLGPVSITGEMSLPEIAAAVAIVLASFRLVQHLTRVNDQVERMWTALMGEGPQDGKSLFSRFTEVEHKVEEIWRRLNFAGVLERRTTERRDDDGPPYSAHRRG